MYNSIKDSLENDLPLKKKLPPFLPGNKSTRAPMNHDLPG